ncbi:MAG: hypothetical protein JW913_05740 [Chitinispirillaceae bacterium]|nr:hypothetical protein [Chitinispirillaceae bacterium]
MSTFHTSAFFRRFCIILAASGLSPLSAAPPSIASGDTILIAANDPRINYYGRFDFTTPAKPRLNWSGAVIEASFPGPIIGMRMVHANAYYDYV